MSKARRATAPSEDGKFSSKLKRIAKKIPGSTILSPHRGRSESLPPAKKVEEVPAASVDQDFVRKFDISELDQRPFIDCDTLFTECESLLKTAQKTIEFAQKNTSPAKSNVVGLKKLNKWRAKRKGHKLFQVFDALHIRIDQSESELNGINKLSTDETTTLVTQSIHLNARLQSCIDFNRNAIETSQPSIEKGQHFLDELKATEKSIEAMIEFYDALADLKLNQVQPYIPWALRQTQQKQESEGTCNEDSDSPQLKRESVVKRLKRVQSVLHVVEGVMSKANALHTLQKNNLEHLQRSQLAMLRLLNRFRMKSIRVATVRISPDLMADILGEEEEDLRRTSANEKLEQERENGNSTTSAMAISVGVNDGLGDGPSTASDQHIVENPAAKRRSESDGGVTVSRNSNGAAAVAAIEESAQDDVSIVSTGSKDSKNRDRTSSSCSAGITNGTAAEKASFIGSDRSDSTGEYNGSSAEGMADGTFGAHIGKTNRASLTQSDADGARGRASTDVSVASNGNLLVPPISSEDSTLLKFAYKEMEQVPFEVPNAYDHAHCYDCSLVFSMANECCMRLVAAEMRAKDSTRRIMRLMNYRDKMRADAELLEAQELQD